MQTEILQMIGNSRATIRTLDSFEAAKDWANEYYSIVHMEDDTDFEGCADALTSNGVVLSIQPVGFKIY